MMHLSIAVDDVVDVDDGGGADEWLESSAIVLRMNDGGVDVRDVDETSQLV